LKTGRYFVYEWNGGLHFISTSKTCEHRDLRECHISVRDVSASTEGKYFMKTLSPQSRAKRIRNILLTPTAAIPFRAFNTKEGVQTSEITGF